MGQVVALKDLKVSTFKGVSFNGGENTFMDDATKMKLKEAKPLNQWYRTVKDKVIDIPSLTEGAQKAGTGSIRDVRLIKEIEENCYNDMGNDPSLRYYINARVELIKNDSKMVYMACPLCKRKMTQEAAGGTHYCQHCDNHTEKPIPTYIITAKLTDGTGSLWTRIYGDNALPIMGNTPPEEMHKMLQKEGEEANVEIRKFLNTLNFKEFSVMIKPSMNSYNGQETLNYNASSVRTVKPEKNNHFLLQRLAAYEKAMA